MKGDVESLDGDAVSIEVKDSNRPDVWSVEGIARVLRSQLNTGRISEVKVLGRSSLKVIIDKRLKPIRPFISAAIVKGLAPTDTALKSWINLQEKLDQTYGRKRKKASIGLYQADLVTSPLSYTVANPDRLEFVPLGSDSKQTLREIIANHPKGLEYGEIISRFHEWPLLIDAEEKILSLPPVINSNDLGRITTGTKNILVEVTGTNIETVHNTLKIMVSCLAARGGRIYSCSENYPYGKHRRVQSPNLSPTFIDLSMASINGLLGATMTPRDASRLAEKAGYRVKQATNKSIHIEIPSYRIDIMHPVDIMEDIAIASDLNKLRPEWPNIWTIGDLSKQTVDEETLGEIMIGLGFQEILTYALTSMEIIGSRMGVDPDHAITLANPKMTTHMVMRNSLMPSLLEFLSQNSHVDYPQRIFEIGSTIRSDDSSAVPVREVRKVAAITIHSQAGFTEIRSSLDAVMRSVGHTFEIEPTESPIFLIGRCGTVMSDGRNVGIIGEINPRILQAFGLALPAAGFELDMPKQIGNEQLVEAWSGKPR